MPLQKDLVANGMWPALAARLGDDPTTVAAGSALTLRADAHADKVILLDTAAGSTVTLPASTGSGNVYRFRVSTAVTSNNHVIKVANASDVMCGLVALGGGTGGMFATLPASDTITMNGTTTGGVLGTEIVITDSILNHFTVWGAITGSGTVATPFSAGV